MLDMMGFGQQDPGNGLNASCYAVRLGLRPKTSHAICLGLEAS